MAQSIFSNMKSHTVPQVVGDLHAEQTAGGAWSEAGIGAVIPWAGKLWFNTYPAENGQGARVGLWSMDSTLTPTLERSSSVTSAARVVANNLLFISRFVIDTNGAISDITGFSANMRPAGYCVTGTGAQTYVWALSMMGEVWRITTTAPYTATLVADNTALNLGAAQPHGKAIWGKGSELFFALNGDGGGRLAKYDTGTGATTVLSSGDWPWIEVAGSFDGNGPASTFYAVGHDRKSVRLWMFPGGSTPVKFRLPLPSRQQLDGWQHEWMRIRQVETERFLMHAYGGFYQLSISTSDKTGTGFPLVEPVCNTARTVTDFASWGGYLVLGSNQNTPQAGNKYPTAGQSDSGLLLTTTDELWSYGKPHGEGLWYDNEAVSASAKSEPMLIRGYGQRSLFISTSAATDVDVFAYHQHREYLAETLTLTAGEYRRLDLPSADWVSIRPAQATTLTAGVVVA